MQEASDLSPFLHIFRGCKQKFVSQCVGHPKHRLPFVAPLAFWSLHTLDEGRWKSRRRKGLGKSPEHGHLGEFQRG